MTGVLSAPRAVLLDLHPTGIVTPVFLGGVIAFLAIITGECDHRTYIFLFRSHGLILQPNKQADAPFSLSNNLSDHTGANRQTTFTNREL